MAVRYFGGGREGGKRSAASEMMRIELQKKGKFAPKDRYKMIMKKKLAASREEALGAKAKKFSLKGTIKDSINNSKTTDKALKELSQKRAAKEARALRNMVMIEPRRLTNGRVAANGKIYDVADNIVGTINKKNGHMATTMGWSIGKYKPRSYMTNMAIQGAINQYSPYFIAQRKAQLGDAFDPRAGGVGVHGQDTINIYGYSPPAQQSYASTIWGNTDGGSERAALGGSAWGVTANNVWGSFSDNAWGTNADNVWGGNDSNIWGGIGDAGNLWKWRPMNVWNTGSGTNYLKGLTSRVMAFFGLSLKGSVHGHDHDHATTTPTRTRTQGTTPRGLSGTIRTGGSRPTSTPRGRTSGHH